MGSSRPAQLSNCEIAARYRAGMSISELVLRTKSQHAVIRDILLAQGVSLRSRAEASRLAQEDRSIRDPRRRRRDRLRSRLGH